VESGPVPPHERTWRHPSEIAAEERKRAVLEAMSPSAKALALTWGTLGVVSVGVLVLMAAPGRTDIGNVARPDASLVAAAQLSLAPIAPTVVQAVATPIRAADGAITSRLAVVTAGDLADGPDGSRDGDDRAVPDPGSPVEVAVPSGRTHTAVILDQLGDAVIVRLEHDEPGLSIRSAPPSANETVTVLASPPLVVALDDLDTLDVAEGTAVVDGAGELVGLCTRGERALVQLAMVDDRAVNPGVDGATTGG
jgi:hypothetical protein